jgi:hypothetical protein
VKEKRFHFMHPKLPSLMPRPVPCEERGPTSCKKLLIDPCNICLPRSREPKKAQLPPLPVDCDPAPAWAQGQSGLAGTRDR